MLSSDPQRGNRGGIDRRFIYSRLLPDEPKPFQGEAGKRGKLSTGIIFKANVGTRTLSVAAFDRINDRHRETDRDGNGRKGRKGDCCHDR